MNSDLSLLHAYPFERLRQLFDGVTPADVPPISLSIGEPKHPAPKLAVEAMLGAMGGLEKYPLTKGEVLLRESIGQWLKRRFTLDRVDPESQVIPVSGTREALFAFAQAVVDRDHNPVVIMPNPFYQIYEGAALLAGAEPWYLNTVESNNFLPDLDEIPPEILQRCQLFYHCSPGNPTGAVADLDYQQRLLKLAEKYDFIVASDECYSEIYPDDDHPPISMLQAAKSLGNDNYQRCVVFNSLSKRSNLPGLRSGFVAGDAEVLKKFLLYRTYQGCALPLPTQAASIAAWQDEAHVEENRQLYRQKFTRVVDILSNQLHVESPEAGFYLWAQVPKQFRDDTDFARQLYRAKNLIVLPGQYLSRQADGINPGTGRIRMALVATLQECEQAAERICQFIKDTA